MCFRFGIHFFHFRFDHKVVEKLVKILLKINSFYTLRHQYVEQRLRPPVQVADHRWLGGRQKLIAPSLLGKHILRQLHHNDWRRLQNQISWSGRTKVSEWCIVNVVTFLEVLDFFLYFLVSFFIKSSSRMFSSRGTLKKIIFGGPC